MHHGAHHCPKQTGCFNWSRIPDQFGTVRYRLYRKDMKGALHYELLHFPLTTPRSEIACSLLTARRRLRELVDDLDLKFMGVVQ